MRFKNLVPFICLTLFCFLQSCQKPFTIVIDQAQGLLYNSAGGCPLDPVSGTFYTGVTPGADTAYVSVDINVIKLGTYSITTNQVDGIYFTDAGTFTSTGINTIRLKPVGTPVTAATNKYALAFSNITCYFEVTVKDSTGLGGVVVTPPVTTGLWQFSTAAGNTTSSTNATGSLVAVAGVNGLAISGTNATGDTALSISLVLPSNKVPTSGTFTALSGNATLQVTAGSTTVYSTVANQSDVTLTVTITSYDAVKKELIGTFSGVVKAAGGHDATLSAGSFDVTVN